MARIEHISITVKAISAQAIRVSDGTMENWIPKSLLSDDTDVDELVVGEVTDIGVQEWFLTKEGWL